MSLQSVSKESSDWCMRCFIELACLVCKISYCTDCTQISSPWCEFDKICKSTKSSTEIKHMLFMCWFREFLSLNCLLQSGLIQRCSNMSLKWCLISWTLQNVLLLKPQLQMLHQRSILVLLWSLIFSLKDSFIDEPLECESN